jgi:argininosuccinate lyase
LKENVIPAIQSAKELLSLIIECIPQLEILPIDMHSDKYKYLYSVELVNQYVLDGMPFRDAYKKVGEMIENGTYEPAKTLNHTHIGSIGNLGLDILRARINKMT